MALVGALRCPSNRLRPYGRFSANSKHARFMDLFNVTVSTFLAMRAWILIVPLMLGLSGCSGVRPAKSQSPRYFWVPNTQTEQIHAAVACTSLHTLQTFNRLFVSGT